MGIGDLYLIMGVVVPIILFSFELELDFCLIIGFSMILLGAGINLIDNLNAQKKKKSTKGA